MSFLLANIKKALKGRSLLETPSSGVSFIDMQSSDFTSLEITETIPSISWETGDLILVFAISSDIFYNSFFTPTVSGLTFEIEATQFVSGDCPLQAWSAIAAGNGSGSISVARNSAINARAGAVAIVFRNHGGLGNISSNAGSASLTQLFSRSSDNSAVIAAFGDWNAVNDTIVSASPSDGTVDMAEYATNYSFFLCHWLNQGASGSTQYGIADHAGGVQLNSILIEILAP